MIDTAAALIKFLLYAGALVSAGSAFAALSLRASLGKAAEVAPAAIIVASLLVIVMAIANVAALIARLGGDFSAPLISAIMATPTGAAAALQVFGAAMLALSVWRVTEIEVAMAANALVLLASFGLNGHAAAAGLIPGVVVFIHAGVAAWWLGALLLLHRACKTLNAPDLVQCVLGFSRQAIAVVGALIVAGVALILTIVGIDLFRWTAYVQTLTMKLLVVTAVLAVATYNKFRLTPQLLAGRAGAVHALRRSITVETALFAGVLAATAWLTTFDSPNE